MADVIQKCISGNDIHEGSALSHVDMLGNKEVLRRDREKTISIQAIEDKLTNRFDEADPVLG